MSVALSIAFTGLCALVGDGKGGRGEILLVDAVGVGAVRGVRLPEHAPTLVISLGDLANPDSSRPTRVIAGTPDAAGRVDQLGLWDLKGSEVRIRPQGGSAGLRLFQPTANETSWPEPPQNTQDPAAWRDLRYVASMQALVGDGRIDPAILQDDDSGRSHLSPAVAARIHLDAGLLEGTIPSQDTYRAEVFEFRGEGSAPGMRQALTDTMQWTLHAESEAIVIEIVPVAGGEARRLLLAPSASPHRLYVSNLPSDNEAHDHANEAMGSDELAALHFAAYYKLLLHEPGDGPLPALWHPLGGPRGTGMIRPIFCPPAVFTLQP